MMKEILFQWVKMSVLFLLIAIFGSCIQNLPDNPLAADINSLDNMSTEGELVFSTAQGQDRSLSVSPASGYVTVTENPAGTYLLAVNLRPYGLPHYKKVLFSVYNSAVATGWTVNIGDSSTNDGWGGDNGTQSNDCEIQVVNGTYGVYASDAGSSQLLYSAAGYNPATGGQYVRYEISNNTVKTWINGDTTTTTTVTNPSLFALDGRNDASGTENYTIYAGFNRTIGNSSRTGSGITNVNVYLQDKIDYELINVASDYSATLKHLMYRKSTLSGKWYANTDFEGYSYFLNGKDPNDWDEKAKEHIFAVEYWKPAAASIKNIVFLAAGQQGLLLDRQDYPSIVTGQESNWHHYDDAPWNAINTWQYMKNDTKPINWKSIPGQIITDASVNGGTYFGMNSSNTYLVMLFDTCNYFDDISASAKTALVEDYLEWIFSKVNNNSANQLKNIYLAGASRGGALVYRMAYQMRHNSTWTSRAGNARIIVSGFDAVANQYENELFTTPIQIDNPLEWINTRFCYYSQLPAFWTNRSNIYAKQIAGGADVVPLVGAQYHSFTYDEVANTLEFDWVNRSHTDIGQGWYEDTSVAHLKWLAKWVVR